MNIILFIDTVAFAGTERHVLDLGKSLVAAGTEVVIACPAASPLTPRCKSAGLPVLDVPSSLRHALGTVAILAAELRAGRVDIIHAHNGRTHLLAVAAVKRAGRGSVVATQHFLAPNRTGRRGPKAALANRLHRWAEHHTAAFVAISNAVKDQMLQRGDAPAEKITVVHNGTVEPEVTAPERIAALRRELGVADRPMVFCAARLQKEKDIPTLIRAFAALRSVNPGAPGSNDGGSKPASLLAVASESRHAGANFQLLTPNSFPSLFIAGDGDQRAECERAIASMMNDGAKNAEPGTLNLEGRGGTEFTTKRGASRSPGAPGSNDDGGGNSGAGPGVPGKELESVQSVKSVDQDSEPRTLNLEVNKESAALPGDAKCEMLNAQCSPSAALPGDAKCEMPTASRHAGAHTEHTDNTDITLLGFRSDVSALMSACDIFVSPCPVEGFGLVLLEAMALGKPVIAAAAGGPLEIVADGETGLLFEPGNAESLSSAIRRLLADPDLRRRMGIAGRKRYAQKFTARRMAENMQKVYAGGQRGEL